MGKKKRGRGRPHKNSEDDTTSSDDYSGAVECTSWARKKHFDELFKNYDNAVASGQFEVPSPSDDDDACPSSLPGASRARGVDESTGVEDVSDSKQGSPGNGGSGDFQDDSQSPQNGGGSDFENGSPGNGGCGDSQDDSQSPQNGGGSDFENGSPQNGEGRSDSDSDFEDESDGDNEDESSDFESVYLRGVREHCCLRDTGLPPVFQNSIAQQGSLRVATFALPKEVCTTTLGKTKVRYTGPWVQTGCCCGPDGEAGEARSFYFCSCSSATANVQNILSLQSTTATGGGAQDSEASSPTEMEVGGECLTHQIEEESCMHIRTLKTIIDEQGYVVSSIIDDLVFAAEERESDRDDGDGKSGKYVEPLGMIQMATSKGVLLWQVGLLGEFGMPAAMIIENPDSRGETSEYKCVVCRSKNCNHLTCLMKSLGLASSKDGDNKTSGASKSAQQAFEESFEKLVLPPDEANDLPTRMKIIGLSRESISLTPSRSTLNIRMRRATNDWPGSGILRLGHYGGDGNDVMEEECAYVIGLGGVIPDVKIYCTSAGLRYDGCEDALLRSAKPNVLFTHELFEEFLAQFYNGRISMKGWFKAKMSVFKAVAEATLKSTEEVSPEDLLTEDRVLAEKASKIIELLKRPSIANDFIDSVFDYIQLLGMDYDVAFTCQCAQIKRCSDFTSLRCVYDNACNLLHSILLRWPALLKRDRHVIDPLHFHSHSNCSPAYNGKLHNSLNDLNTAINEQKNRFTNRARTSLSGMSQIRALILMRHFISMINCAQRAVNLAKLGGTQPLLPSKSVVCDGSKTSFPRKSCFMVRPWIPEVNKADLPSSLFRGAELDQALMIHDHRLRSILESAMEGKYIQKDSWRVLTKWVTEERECLSAYFKEYLKLVPAPLDGSMLRLERKIQSNFFSLLRHWASGAPEVVLLPCATFEAVREIIATRLVSPASAKIVGLHSPLLRTLIDLRLSKVIRGGLNVSVSDDLVALLQVCLKKAENCLKSCGGAAANYRAAALNEKGASNAWENCFKDSMDEFLRTGIWTSSEHPVVREIPRMRYDLLAAKSNEQYHKKVAKEELDLLEKLVCECDLMGCTCNKYKSKVRSLTPGLFTVYCGGCGVCELFELLPEAESPVTVFRTFAHRAWTVQELAAYEKWKNDGEWIDPFPCEFYEELFMI